jgi:orotate phosphoribosyltransferase-like protein
VGRIQRVAEVSESALLTEQEAARRLGLSVSRVRWLTFNGHLQRGVTADGRARGLTEESVQQECDWRSGASLPQRLRRALSYAFTWLP